MPIASVAPMKSRSTTGWAAPRATRATRGAVVRAIARTITQFFAPTRLTATSASMICGNAMITSIARIRMSSSALRAYAATRPIATPKTRPIAVETTAITRMLRPPYRKRLEHVLPEVVGAEDRCRWPRRTRSAWR